MNLFLMTISDEDDKITRAQVFKSEMSFREICASNWDELAQALGFEASYEEGDCVDIEPVTDPPILF